MGANIIQIYRTMTLPLSFLDHLKVKIDAQCNYVKQQSKPLQPLAIDHRFSLYNVNKFNKIILLLINLHQYGKRVNCVMLDIQEKHTNLCIFTIINGEIEN